MQGRLTLRRAWGGPGGCGGRRASRRTSGGSGQSTGLGGAAGPIAGCTAGGLDSVPARRVRGRKKRGVVATTGR